jgi:uncharacterized protein YuzE
MNANYDIETDTLTIVFKPGDVAESDEDKPNVVLDYNTEGELIGMEILDASKHIADVTQFQFRVTTPHA